MSVTTTLQSRNGCIVCPVRSCLGREPDQTASNWSEILERRLALSPGGPTLIDAGSPLRAVYSVRAGCLKTYTIDADGHERIRGFHLPGDLIGLDALDGGVSRSSAAAVSPSQVCVAPLADLQRVMRSEPELAMRLTRFASRELAIALAVAGEFTAEQRLAAFLLYMEDRLGPRGGLLRLPMPQRDIGNYLRLATETVCRTIKYFVGQGWLVQQGRAMRLIDRRMLERLGAPVAMEPTPVQARAVAFREEAQAA